VSYIGIVARMGDRYRGRDSSRARSPPPRRQRDDSRGPPRRSDKGGGKGDRKTQQGQHKITIEGIPDDMSWTELKELGKDCGPSVTFARTYRSSGINFGMIEFSNRADADACIKDLDQRRVQGSSQRLRASYGDTAAEGGLGKYKGRGEYEGDRGGKGGRRDSRSPPPQRRSPPPRRSRTPPRRSPGRGGGGRGGGGGGGDEEITTVFVKGLPDDARDTEIKEDIGDVYRVARVVIMHKGDYCSAFVRFESVRDAERAMDDIVDGKLKVCGRKVQAEMARRNTSL